MATYYRERKGYYIAIYDELSAYVTYYSSSLAS